MLRQADRLTVIDTGNGEFGGPTSGNWLKNFRAAGYDPSAVTSVVISHFHGGRLEALVQHFAVVAAAPPFGEV